jgi:hypothetical protein
MKLATCDGCGAPTTAGHGCDACRTGACWRSRRTVKARPSRLKADRRLVRDDLPAAAIERALRALDARRRLSRWRGGIA